MSGLHLENDSAHEQLYGLYNQALFQFNQALEATVSPVPREITDSGVKAGYAIFDATLQALSHYHWNGNLPLLDDSDLESSSAALLPPPVLVALAYFLDTAQTASLSTWQLTSGASRFDRAILSWPNTLLWSLPAKTRFFYDLTENYTGTRVENPLLSDNRLRAIQLLVVGRHLLQKQIDHIGQPGKLRLQFLS